jgi:hypothetical protein
MLLPGERWPSELSVELVGVLLELLLEEELEVVSKSSRQAPLMVFWAAIVVSSVFSLVIMAQDPAE